MTSISTRGLATLAVSLVVTSCGSNGKDDPSASAPDKGEAPCFECRLTEQAGSSKYVSTQAAIEDVVVGTWEGDGDGQDGLGSLRLTVQATGGGEMTFGEPYNAVPANTCTLDDGAWRACAMLRVPVSLTLDEPTDFGPAVDNGVTVYGFGLGEIDAPAAARGELSAGVAYVSFDGGAKGSITFGLAPDGSMWAQFKRPTDDDVDEAPPPFVVIGSRRSE